MFVFQSFRLVFQCCLVHVQSPLSNFSETDLTPPIKKLSSKQKKSLSGRATRYGFMRYGFIFGFIHTTHTLSSPTHTLRCPVSHFDKVDMGAPVKNYFLNNIRCFQISYWKTHYAVMLEQTQNTYTYR